MGHPRVSAADAAQALGQETHGRQLFGRGWRHARTAQVFAAANAEEAILREYVTFVSR